MTSHRKVQLEEFLAPGLNALGDRMEGMEGGVHCMCTSLSFSPNF